MTARTIGRDEAGTVTGPAVVIDVLRAFTTAAYAFEGGVAAIVLVAGIDEAFALRAEHPDWLLMGENAARPVDGFDFRNSPADLRAADLRGRVLVQRTSSGTQGVVGAANASLVLCAGLVNASATAALLRSLGAPEPTYVATGNWTDEGRSDEGDEDAACADVIEAARLFEPLPDVRDRVLASKAARRLLADPVAANPADVDLCLQVDRFGFAMQVTRRDGLAWLEAVG